MLSAVHIGFLCAQTDLRGHKQKYKNDKVKNTLHNHFFLKVYKDKKTSMAALI
jgi:hypothetical protein